MKREIVVCLVPLLLFVFALKTSKKKTGKAEKFSSWNKEISRQHETEMTPISLSITFKNLYRYDGI